MKRVLLTGLALAALAAGVALVIFLRSLDAWVERIVEREGTRAVGTEVHLDRADVEIARARGSLSGLHVANPEGFEGRDVFDLGEIRIAIEPSSLRAQPLHLTRVEIGDTTVRVVYDERGASNLAALVSRIAERRDAGGDDDPPAEPRRLRIDELEFVGGEILVQQEGEEAVDRIELPRLRLENLGGRDGATGSEIGRRVALALTQRAALAAAGSELGRMVERELGGTLGEAAGAAIREIFD